MSIHTAKKMKQDSPDNHKHTVDRYDRQLRLWDSSGQQALNQSTIMCLGANVLGSESLKNLVLSGIGSFVLVDSRKVTQMDLNSNFFVSNSDLGRSLSESMVARICELNPQVHGVAKFQDIDEFASYKSNFGGCKLVICCNQDSEILQKVVDVCWSLGVPVIDCLVNGFFGSMKYYVAQHCVVEGHEEQVEDMRISEPFKEIEDYTSSIDFDSLDSVEKSHIPYIVLMLRKLKEYKKITGLESLNSFQEKKGFKTFLESSSEWEDEENYLEMVSNAIRLSANYEIPARILSIFENKCLELIPDNFSSIPAKNLKFWIIVKAIKEFVYSETAGNGKLPLKGTIPDMKADTKRFIELQKIYKNKAKRDVNVVVEYTNKLLEAIKNLDPAFEHSISEKEIEIFCSNSSELKAIEFKKPNFILASAIQTKIAQLKQAGLTSFDSSFFDSISDFTPLLSFDDFGSSEITFTLVEAAVLFNRCNGRYPGQKHMGASETQGDKNLLNAICCLLCENWRNILCKADEKNNDKDMSETSCTNYGFENGENLKTSLDFALSEVIRSQGSELHSVAALIGGVVSQEAIKLITNHYANVELPILFDGIKSNFYPIVIKTNSFSG